MFSSLDKAIVGLLMAAIFIANNAFGMDLGIGEGTVNAIAGVLTPVLVYLVPNK